jgi:hypothetical protein
MKARMMVRSRTFGHMRRGVGGWCDVDVRRGAIVLAVSLATLVPAVAQAWGLAAHRWVARRAAAMVDRRCAGLGERYAAELADRTVEPDTVLRAQLGRAEEVRHFLDLDHYGAPPFRRLPRGYEDAVARFGLAALEEQGVLPWHAERLARRLADEAGRGDWPAARVTAGHLAHYAADATMPLHATENYDGQLSGQRGLHRRIEATLVDDHLGRFVERAARAPARPSVPPERCAAALFATLDDSYAAVGSLLVADRAARRGTRVGSALYYRRLETELGDLLGTRLGIAAALTAALWEGACAGG